MTFLWLSKIIIILSHTGGGLLIDGPKLGVVKVYISRTTFGLPSSFINFAISLPTCIGLIERPSLLKEKAKSTASSRSTMLSI